MVSYTDAASRKKIHPVPRKKLWESAQEGADHHDSAH